VQAQTVRGEVVTETGAPVVGAFVALFDAEGARRGAVLTGRDGRFTVRAPAAGVYRLQVELIGHETHDSGLIDLAAGQTVVRTIVLRPSAVLLEGITARGDGRCRLRRDAGRETQQVWEEARKALSIVAWLESDGRMAYQARVYERTRDIADGGLIDAGTHLRRQQSGVGKTPFHTAEIDDLAGRGYVQAIRGGGYHYYGVDAPLLLSDGFLDTHCLRVVKAGSGDGARVGLAFEPIPGRTLPDVDGVLWLDARTFELQRVDYRFTLHPHALDIPLDAFGGSTAFRRLANGAWVTSEWNLRMPDYIAPLPLQPPVRRAGSPLSSAYERRLAARVEGLAVREQGGEVAFIAAATGGGGDGVVQGVVYDSTRQRPLAGATVFTTASPHTARTDARGRFTLRGLQPGEQQLGFFHPYTDSLALPTPLVTASIADEPVDVSMAIPTAAFCTAKQLEGRFVDDGQEIVLPGTGIVGFAEDIDTGVPVAGVQVVAEWEFIGRWRLREALRGNGPKRLKGVESVSEADGRFLLCGVPMGSTAQIRADGGPRVRLEIDRLMTMRNLIAH
jgi:hypothetical protein